MKKRTPIIAVRPRRGSALETEQNARDNDMADILHSWAEMFSLVAKKGETTDE